MLRGCIATMLLVVIAIVALPSLAAGPTAPAVPPAQSGKPSFASPLATKSSRPVQSKEQAARRTALSSKLKPQASNSSGRGWAQCRLSLTCAELNACRGGVQRVLNRVFDCAQQGVDELLYGYTCQGPASSSTANMLAILRAGSRSSFIETGTNVGVTFMTLVNTFAFEHLFSVEYSPVIYRKNLDRVSAKGIKLRSDKSVHLLQGDSGKLITKMLTDAAATPHGSKGAVVWLDAHYSSGDTAGSDQKEPPLLDELRAVLSDSVWASHVIAIDDMRLWTGRPTVDKQIYPQPSRVHSETCKRWPNAIFRVHDDQMAIWPNPSAPGVPRHAALC